MSKCLWAGGSGSEELMECPPPSLAVLWFVNVHETKPYAILFLCDCESNIINYSDDTTLYACEPSMDLVLSTLEKDTLIVFTWFHKYYLESNSGKPHLILSCISMLGGTSSVVASMKNYLVCL